MIRGTDMTYREKLRTVIRLGKVLGPTSTIHVEGNLSELKRLVMEARALIEQEHEDALDNHLNLGVKGVLMPTRRASGVVARVEEAFLQTVRLLRDRLCTPLQNARCADTGVDDQNNNEFAVSLVRYVIILPVQFFLIAIRMLCDDIRAIGKSIRPTPDLDTLQRHIQLYRVLDFKGVEEAVCLDVALHRLADDLEYLISYARDDPASSFPNGCKPVLNTSDV
jgi:hypothetical protein